MLQHSRLARSDSQALLGYGANITEPQRYTHNVAQTPISFHNGSGLQRTYQHLTYPRPPTASLEQLPSQNDAPTGNMESPQAIQTPLTLQARQSYSGHSNTQSPSVPGGSHRSSRANVEQDALGYRSSIDDTHPTSPVSVRGLDEHQSDGWDHRPSDEASGPINVKEELDPKPSWADQKTKAGKERKRLPLACIACRRKKIRCSGEKPACKHCTRARMPCVYKVTPRKAAPRTDYMAMLDRRLKRMEDRVIKTIPKEDMVEALAIPRASIRPPAAGHGQNGKKRGAQEAFGAQIEEWAGSKSSMDAFHGTKTLESKVNTEGREHLPPKEIQEHLSEVFFDYLYGQSYHLMHKPSYMRRLRYVYASNQGEYC